MRMNNTARLCLWLAAVAACVCAVPGSAQKSAAAPAGHVIGRLNAISQDGDHFFLAGWACQRGQTKSIVVQLFGENGAPLVAETANLFSESSVNQACLDHASGRHRFLIALPYGFSANSQVIVRGLQIVDGVPNDAIAGSNLKLAQLTGLNVPYPALPLLAGAYRGLTEPGVFASANELKDLASRVNRANSYSRQRFALLAAQIQRDLDSGIDWDVTYSGAGGGVYQYAFSYLRAAGSSRSREARSLEDTT